MQVNTAKFLESNPSVKTCPSPHLPEYAFIGRSNVGKSSLINAMTNHGNLAKTSSTPGKTQLINHFLINESWYLVDLPGYGWARVSKSQRRDFEGLITEYLAERENLVITFVLVDIRHEPQPIDLQFLEWLGENQIPFAIIFTKSDKLNNSKIVASLERYEMVLKSGWEALPPHFITSSVKNEGTEDILNYIEKYNKALKEKFAKIQPIKVDKTVLEEVKEQTEEQQNTTEVEKIETKKKSNEKNQTKEVAISIIPSSSTKKKKATKSKHTVPFPNSKTEFRKRGKKTSSQTNSKRKTQRPKK